MSDHAVAAAGKRSQTASSRPATWAKSYLRGAALADLGCAIAAVTAALRLRFNGYFATEYIALSLALPLLWLAALWLAGAYDARFVGTGSDEFRKVFNAGVSLTAGLAILSCLVHSDLSRGYLVIAVPGLTALDLIARFVLRKRLHRQRAAGRCTSTVIAVGPEPALSDLITELQRDIYHGLTVVGACVAGTRSHEVAGVPVAGGLGDVSTAVRRCGADTVVVLSCPEIDGLKLRSLAWVLEKTGTDLCVARSLLDVAGLRTTVRPTAGLTLLHVDHPQLSGPRQVMKGLFDRCAAGAALILLSPLMLALAVAIRLSGGSPAPFTQTRAGKDGRVFKICKFRAMVVDAKRLRSQLMAGNDLDGVLFKLRRWKKPPALRRGSGAY